MKKDEKKTVSASSEKESFSVNKEKNVAKIKSGVIVEKKYTDEEQKKMKENFIKKIENLRKKDIDLNKGIFEYNYENFLTLISTKDFVDLRVHNGNITLEYFWGEEKSEMVGFSFEKLYEDLNKITEETGFNNKISGKYFSFHLPMVHEDGQTFLQGFRGILKTSIDGNEMTIRKLTTPRKLQDFIFDPILISCVLKGLLSRKGFVVSGKTGSGKSTILISLLNFFNNTDYSLVMINEINRIFCEFITNKSFDTGGKKGNNKNQQEENKTLSYINNVYNSTENANIMIDDITYCFMKIKGYIWKKYSLKGEILPSIKILRIIEAYLTQKKDEKMEAGGKLILNIINEHRRYLMDHINECENQDLFKNIKKFSLSRLRNITTLEEPIEFIYGKEGILRFYQHSLSQHFNGDYFEFINQILRDNPHICYIAEVRNQGEIDTFLTSMSLGITSMTTCHSYDSIEVLLKFIDLSNKGSGEVINTLTNSFNSGINIESYFFVSLKPIQKIVSGFIQWFDYLDFSIPSITTMFRNYYLKNELNQFIAQMYAGHTFMGNRLGYYPKKYTLNFRLMLLIDDLHKNVEKIKETNFDLDVFYEEMIDLLYNTNSFLDVSEIQNIKLIYGEQTGKRIAEFLMKLEGMEKYNTKKSSLKG